MGMLTEDNGKQSSKRVMGVVILFTMLLLFSYKEVKDLAIINLEIFISFLVTAGTLLGITVFRDLSRKK